MTEVGKRLGMDVKFTNIPFPGLFAAVQSGQIDAAVSSITITKKRLESVSFAQPYYDSDQSLTVKTDSGITGLAGMEGKIVGVDTGSTGDMWTTAHQAETKIATINKYEGLQPAMLDLQAGPHRRLHLRHPGAALLLQGQAAVQSGRAHQDHASNIP